MRWSNVGHFLKPGFLFNDGFETRFLTRTTYFYEYFLLIVDAEYSETVGLVSNALGVRGAGSRNGDGRQQPPSTDHKSLLAEYSFHVFIIRGKLATFYPEKVAILHNICVRIYYPSTQPPRRSAFLVATRPAQQYRTVHVIRK